MNVKKIAAGLAAALIIVAAALYGADVYVQGEAKKQVEASFAHLPMGMQGRYGAVSYSLLGDRLVLDEVALDLPDQSLRSLRAARVELNGVNHGFVGALLSRSWGAAGDAWSVGSVEASNVEYDFAGGFHQTALHMVVSDPRLDLSGDTPVEQRSLAQWIRALSWSSGTASDLRASTGARAEDGGFSLTVASRDFAALRDGRLAASIDHGLTWDATIAPFGKIHAEAAEGRAGDVDLLAWDRLFNPANYRTGERDPSFYTLCGDLRLSKVAINVAGDSAVALSFDGLTMAGVKMRQLPFPPDAPPAEPTLEQSLDLVHSFSLGGIEIDKLALSSADVTDTAFAFDRMALKLDDKNHAELSNLSLKTPEAAFTLGRLQLDGFDMRLPENLLPLLDPRPQTQELGGPMAVQPVPTPSAAPTRPGFFVEHFELADVAAQHPEVGEIALKDLTLTMTGDIDRPTGATLDMQHLGLDLGTIGRNPGAEMLSALGYGQVLFDAHSTVANDLDAKTIESHFSLSAAEMGALNLGYRLSGYDFDWNMGDQDALMERVMNIAIDGIELRYDDASLADRIIGALAARANQPPAEMRHGFVTMLEQQKSEHRAEPLVVNALDAVIDFIVKPTAIRLTVKPARPVTLDQLSRLDAARPNEIMARLGVTVDRPQ